MHLHLRKYTALPIALALLLPAAAQALANTPQETAYECVVTEGSTIVWTPGRNLLKSTYAKEHEFTGAVHATGGDPWRSEHAHVWEVDPAVSRVIIGPQGNLESGQIRAKQSNLAVELRNTKRTFLVNVNVFNPYIRIEDSSTLVAGIGASWADQNNGKSDQTEPVDVVRGEFDFELNAERTMGRLVPHADELGGLATHNWIVPEDAPVYQALRVGLRDAKFGRPYERASADLNFTCSPFQRDVSVNSPDQDNDEGTSAPTELAAKFCAVDEGSSFAWGVKRSWRDYLATFAAGSATHSENVGERLAQVHEDATLGYNDAKLEGAAALPRQSRYQYIFPVDTDRSYVTLDASNGLIDLRVRTRESWVRFTSEAHGFDNAILSPEAYVLNDQLKVAGTSDVSMTPQGGTKIEKVGNHAEFLRGQFTQDIADDLSRLRVEHAITGTDSRNRILATSVYTKNADSALVFAGTYDDGVEADPAQLDLRLNCRDITPENPAPDFPGRADATPLDRALLDMPTPVDNEYLMPGLKAEATGGSVSVELPARPDADTRLAYTGQPVFVEPLTYALSSLLGQTTTEITNEPSGDEPPVSTQVPASSQGPVVQPKSEQRLAKTGANVSVVALVGGAMLAVGALVIRRRR